MNRIVAYFLIISGVPMGYLFSYFWQPAMSRILYSLSDYFSSFNGIVFIGREVVPTGGAMAEIAADMQVLAWAGIVMGVIFMGALVMASNKSGSRRARMLWVCGVGLLVGFVSMLIVPGIVERRAMEHTMPPGIRQLLDQMRH